MTADDKAIVRELNARIVSYQVSTNPEQEKLALQRVVEAARRRIREIDGYARGGHG